MQDKWKYAVIGAVAGTAAAVIFAAPSIIPLAMADEQPIRTLQAVKTEALNLFEPRRLNLFKPQWTADDTVSQEVESSYQVRKIEAGRSSVVQVITTSSGVYSSDAMGSPHVRYPGFHREAAPDFDAVAYLSDGSWVGITLKDADSMRTIVPLAGGGYILTRQ